MSVSESGWKWWLRYVVVPIVAGSGLVALLVKQVEQNPQPRTHSELPHEVQSDSTKQARLQVTVEPDPVTMCIPDPDSACLSDRSNVTYRFRELNGIGARIESYERRWILPDGTELYREIGHSIAGDSLDVEARGSAELPDSVYVPLDAGYKAKELSQQLPVSEPQLYVETTFLATDFNDHNLKVRVVLRVLASRMPGGPAVLDPSNPDPIS